MYLYKQNLIYRVKFMNIILTEKVNNLGNLGDIVKVKPGYARNYLLPQGKAIRATKELSLIHI